MVAAVMLLVLVLATDAWVFWDATQQVERGEDVVASVGPVTLDRPEHWLLACLILWVIALPMYLVARRRS